MRVHRRRLIGAVLLLVALVLLLLWMVVLDDPAVPTTDGSDPTDPVAAVHAAGGAADGEQAPPDTAATIEMERKGRGRITGTLRRGDDQSPIAGVTVRLHSSGTAIATTDERGRFSFDRLDRRGSYTLEIRVTGTGDLLRTGLVIGRRGSLDLGDLFLAPPARIEVEVVDTRGRPVAGAKVVGYTVGPGAPDFVDRTDPRPTVTAHSGDDGRATFSALTSGRWIFVASRQGFGRRGTEPIEVRPASDTRRFLLTLDTAEPLTGRVLEEDGSAVPRARIVALRRTIPHDAAAAPLALRTYADAMGRFQFDSLPLGDTVLWVARPGEDLMVIAAVRKPGVERLDLVLPPASRVRGVVRDARTGDPIAAVTLTAVHETTIGVPLTAVGETDGEGRFDIALPGPGILERVAARAEGFLRHEEPIDLALHGGDTHEVELRLRRGVPIGGVVNGPGGPVAFAIVEVAAREGGFGARLETDRRGEFRLDAVPPDVPLMLDAWSAGLDAGLGSHRLETARQGARNWYDLELRAGVAIVGRVLGGDGEPLEGAAVWLDTDPTGWRARTDADGRYRIPSVSPGSTVVLRFAHQLHAPASRELGVESDETDAGTLRMRAATRVRGSLRSASGEPLTDAYVQVAGLNGTTLPHPTDAEWLWLSFERLPVAPDGTFDHVLPLVDSHVLIRAVAAGHAPRLAAPLALDAVAARPVHLVLDAGAEVEGRVLDTDDRPLRSASVFIRGREPGESLDSLGYPGALGPPAVATTDADGRFRLRHVAPGAYAIEARTATGGRRAGVLIEVPGTSDVVIRIP